MIHMILMTNTYDTTKGQTGHRIIDYDGFLLLVIHCLALRLNFVSFWYGQAPNKQDNCNTQIPRVEQGNQTSTLQSGGDSNDNTNGQYMSVNASIGKSVS